MFNTKVIDNLRKLKRDIPEDTRKIIEKYIRDKNLVVYGGFAIDILLRDKTGKGIYNADDSYDYDVYSENFDADAQELMSILKLNGSSWMRIVTGINGKTRKVFINLIKESVIDFSYMKNVEEIVLPGKINGYRICNPQHMKIDQYKNVHDNLFGFYHRIPKAIKKIELLERYFPPTDETYQLTKNKVELVSNQEKVIDTTAEGIVKLSIDKMKDHWILGGDLVANYYIGNGLIGTAALYTDYEDTMFYDILVLEGNKQVKIATRFSLLFTYYNEKKYGPFMYDLYNEVTMNYFNIAKNPYPPKKEFIKTMPTLFLK
jgi:hypothetical protein